MRFAAVQDGVFTGVVYESLTDSVWEFVAQAGQWLAGVDHIIEEGQSPTVPELIECQWLACKNYQERIVDANGLVGLLYKAQQGGTKAAADLAWVDQLWADYYSRRQAVEAGSPPDYDFSGHGLLPHPYFDAISEVV